MIKMVSKNIIVFNNIHCFSFKYILYLNSKKEYKEISYKLFLDHVEMTWLRKWN